MRDEFVDLIRDLKIYSELKTHPEVNGTFSYCCTLSQQTVHMIFT